MANKIGSEIKKTFGTLSNAFKSEDQQQVAVAETESVSSNTKNTKEINAEKMEKYSRTLNKAENDYSGRLINTVSQKNKPRRAIYINESKNVRAMEMKDKDDAYIVVDEIREKQNVLVKLDGVSIETRKEILNIIYGACHYANIAIEQIADQMILIDPSLTN
ncbi:cell division protein SepF [Bacillus toyonensis]|uniref:cell division protein SepF n=1 Tax=Bacillus toyonensis TaxID=155322 RepID=UPI002E1CEDC2|nr:cell division protein SepF [Bacillus toyonensis]